MEVVAYWLVSLNTFHCHWHVPVSPPVAPGDSGIRRDMAREMPDLGTVILTNLLTHPDKKLLKRQRWRHVLRPSEIITFSAVAGHLKRRDKAAGLEMTIDEDLCCNSYANVQGGRLIGKGGAFEAHTGLGIDCCSDALEPGGPVGGACHGMQQPNTTEIVRTLQLVRCLKCWRTDRDQLDINQLFAVEIRPVPLPCSNGGIQVLRFEIDRCDGGTETHLDPRKSVVKLRQARDQPPLRECRVGLDGENVPSTAARDTPCRIADLQECAGDAIVKLLPLVGQFDTAMQPLEQNHTEIILQDLDLPADGHLRHVQLLRCVCQAR